MIDLKEILGFVGIVVVLLAISSRCQPYDSTDDIANKDRSGLMLYVDHGTGCEYLGKVFGPPVPRLDRFGKQVCRAPRNPL